jgi:RNA polymerase sigma-B factor
VSQPALLRETPPVPPPPLPSQPRSPEREQLIARHRYLCSRGARKFLRPGLERADLEQVAAIGLIKASDRYDQQGPTPFEAFAWLMILGELGHHVRDHEHAIRLPRQLRALERRYAAAWERLSLEFAREPRDGEIARAIGAAPASVEELRRLRACAQPLRFDADIRADRRLARRGTGADGSIELVDRILLCNALESLSTLERRIVVGLYWLELSRAELGRRLGLPAKTVARTQRGALHRLRLHAASTSR